MTTLRSCEVSCLFIKDDFGSDGFGDYYLGCNGTYSVEDAVIEMVREYIHSLSPKKLIFAGSSKGEYAALNFGLRFPNAEIIVAAPQYRLGDYLWGDNGDRRFADTQRIFIHYSAKEHTYPEHIQYLLQDLEKRIYVEKDEKDYQVHGNLKYYFPEYLKAKVNLVYSPRKRW